MVKYILHGIQLFLNIFCMKFCSSFNFSARNLKKTFHFNFKVFCCFKTKTRSFLDHSRFSTATLKFLILQKYFQKNIKTLKGARENL